MILGFVVDPAGVVYPLEMTPAVSRAYDLMVAAGVSPEKASSLAVGAERAGYDPVKWTQKFLSLRKVLKK